MKRVILIKHQAKKVQIRLSGCTGWSALLLLAYNTNSFLYVVAHTFIGSGKAKDQQKQGEYVLRESGGFIYH